MPNMFWGHIHFISNPNFILFKFHSSCAGNTVGAIGVFLLVGNIFKRMHYYESLQYLSFIMSALLFLFTGLYLIPQRHISKYPDDDLKSASSSGNYLI